MKTTKAFQDTIQRYLDEMAQRDLLFADKLNNPNKSIEGCVNFILSEVQKSGINGFTDQEIYSMAVHYFVEEDITKIEQGKRNYFEDAKELCTFEEYYAYGDKNTYRTDGSVNLRGVVTNPYSVGTNYFGNGDFYNNGIKTVYNKIKEINYTFKGYRSVDYDALNYSLLYLGCSYYNTYGFILEGGCNFTTAGIAMIYGDYKDGKYHSLIAEYTIDSKDGEALYNLARSFCSKGI